MSADQEAVDRIEDYKHKVREKFDKAIAIMNDIAGMSDNGEPITDDVLRQKHENIREHVSNGIYDADHFSKMIQKMRENE